MDLSNEIRKKLYSKIQKDLAKQVEQSKNNSLHKMKEILKVWLEGRIDDNIRNLVRANSEQIKILSNISLHRKYLNADLVEFDQDRGFYISIKFDKEDAIPLLPWIKDFGNCPHKYVDTSKEKLLYRELQNALIEFERSSTTLNKFCSTYCFSDYWSHDAETFLQPQKIDTSDQLREEFPEWYYKYFIPCIEENPEPNLNGWESLVKILKK